MGLLPIPERAPKSVQNHTFRTLFAQKVRFCTLLGALSGIGGKSFFAQINCLAISAQWLVLKFIKTILQGACHFRDQLKGNSRSGKPNQKGRFMNFSGGGGANLNLNSMWIVLVFPGKTPESTKKGELHELFIAAFFLVWSAGAPFFGLVCWGDSWARSLQKSSKFWKPSQFFWPGHSHQTRCFIYQKSQRTTWTHFAPCCCIFQKIVGELLIRNITYHFADLFPIRINYL